jgi:hypothetical protein
MLHKNDNENDELILFVAFILMLAASGFFIFYFKS